MTRTRVNILAFFLLSSPFIYMLFVYQSVNFFNINNFIIYILSACICFYSFWDIKNNGIKPHNLFLLVFYIFLFWNTSNLGGIQLEKTAKDVYYYFLGPLIFAVILWLSYHVKVPKLNSIVKLKFNANLISLILLAIYILLKVYIGSVVGYRIESVDAGYLEPGDKYSLPGFTGLTTILQWTLVMFIPHIKKRYAILILLFIVLFSFLHVKRGDLARIFVFLTTYFFVVKVREQKYFSLKKIALIVLVFFSFSVLFAEFGEWRRANQLAGSIIKEYLDSKSDSIVLNWIYAYTTIPFDVLKIYDGMDHPYFPYGLVAEFSDPNSRSIQEYALQEQKANINGFNVGTFLAQFIHDYGIFYFVEIILLGIYVSLLIVLTRMFNFFGIYCVILTLLVLTFFGNYFASPGLLYSFIFAVILFNFVRFDDEIII